MNRLKQLRESRGLTQKEVADVICKAPSNYANYETGRRDMGTDTLLILADFFGVTTDYILGRDREAELEAKANEKQLDELLVAEIQQLMSKVKDLDQKQTKQVYQYIDFLKSIKETE